ncbi:baseplate J/gp47 family protein, partial [Acinetobacter sp. GWC1_38_13]|uniref:baseplate J/gp47 family protein n=1 Tax=Acinetobacter sp. GWC1_38_13 TaxID=1797234 RepID=UPI00257ACAD8
DEETDDDFRERILLRKQFPPYGGCSYDYWRWMLEYTGVTRAWVFPSYNGVGTVGCAFVMDDISPYIPSAANVALVRAYLVEHEDPATGRTVGIPVTAEPGLFMITLTELPINITVNIYPNTSAIQSSIESEIQDLIDREGGPGETIYVSDIQSALGRVSDLEYFSLAIPVADITALTNQIHAIGTITFGDY